MIEQHPDSGCLPTRREVLTLGMGAFLVAALPWSRRGPRLERRTIPVMGTNAEIAVVHGDAAYARRAIQAAFMELQSVEGMMTRFRADSDVGRANLHAASAPVPVSRATAEVLSEALRWAEISDGRFDPAYGGAVELWDVARRREPPSSHEIRRFAGRQLFRSLELGSRSTDPVVIFHQAGMSIDLGGIAKGYAVDRAVDVLRGWGIRHALVNAGGDLFALGRSPGGDPWRVGIQSPDSMHALAATIPLEDRALATSGDYQQFFAHGGRRYHHLLDTATGEPRRSSIRSLTVESDRCMTADVAGTALFGCSPEVASAILARAPSTRVVHRI
jgi:FAD:protein FMN transferase